MVHFQYVSTAFVTSGIIAVVSVFIVRRLRASLIPQAKKLDHIDGTDNLPEPTALVKEITLALPDISILPQDVAFSKDSMNRYWAQQECEVVPSCVIQPRDVSQLSKTITILKHEHDKRRSFPDSSHSEKLFAIRAGGHSPVPGAASIKNGVLIDLSRLRDVKLSEDRSIVSIGAGAKWMDVSKTLDTQGLAVVGGRNSAVGVGGLVLGGGVSFFSPRFGMVCSNIVDYEVVLADGTVITASSSTNPDLWRALKGGANNFGIVTQITMPTFSCTKVWSGFLYLLPSQTTKVLAAFHKSVSRAGSDDANTAHAAGPIACFSYVAQLGVQAIAVNLVSTELPEGSSGWPSYWKNSPFKSLWRLWSTCKIRRLTDATDEMNALNPPGRRQVFATLTIKNDPATLTAVHGVYRDAIATLKPAKVKELVWTLVFQPLLSEWGRKGDPNSLGLGDGPHEALVLVNFTVNWAEAKNDVFVRTTTRRAIEEMEAITAAKGTGHRYRYLNYCAGWQKPFEGYGEENHKFLQDTGRKYDPNGLFQTACTGMFKLGTSADK